MTHAEALRIFQLDDRRTPEELRATYRELVKVWHPDRFANDPDLRAKADRRLQEINRAYAVLQDRAETVEPPRKPTPSPHASPPQAPTPRSADHSTPRSTDEPTPRAGDDSTPRARDESTPARWSLALLVVIGLLTGAAVVGIILMLVRPAQQAPAPRPISGTDLLAAPLAGEGSLIVLNADGRDAVLAFVDAGVQTRTVYIRAGERLQLLDISPGAYRIWIAAGRDWTGDHFATDPMFHEIGEPLTFVNDPSAPQTITIAGPETATLTRLRARSPFPLNVRR
jgi:DnaJ domain